MESHHLAPSKIRGFISKSLQGMTGNGFNVFPLKLTAASHFHRAGFEPTTPFLQKDV